MVGINSFFDEQRVVARTPIIELKSIFGVDPLRDITVGDVTNDGSEYVIVAAAGGTQNARLDSAERGPYPPGQEVEPGIAFRPVSVPTGGQTLRVGYYDDEDGFFIEFTAAGMRLVVRRDGIDSTVSDWGVWDGEFIARSENSREPEFRPLDGYVYQFPFVWYGFGPASYTFQMRESLYGEWIRTLGTTRPTGQTSIIQPHLPLRAEAITGPGDDALECRVSGRQVSIVGQYKPIFRQTSIEATLANVSDTEWLPILAVRRKSIKPYALTKLESLTILSDTSVRVAIMEGATIANTANWAGEVSDYGDLSLLEENVTPGGAGLSGNTLAKMLVSGGGQGKQISGTSESISRAFMIEDRPFLIAVRKIAGAQSGIVTIEATFREDF